MTTQYVNAYYVQLQNKNVELGMHNIKSWLYNVYNKGERRQSNWNELLKKLRHVMEENAKPKSPQNGCPENRTISKIILAKLITVENR